MNENWTSPTWPPSDGSASASTLPGTTPVPGPSCLHTVPKVVKTWGAGCGMLLWKARWEGSRTCSVSLTRGASYGKAISPWWFLTHCFSPSFHGAQMWNTQKITATWWVQARLCSRWIRCLLQHSASPWVTLLLAVFPLDFTRFGSVPRCAGKETSREAQIQSKRNVSDKAAVHQGTLTILGALLLLPWGCMMCLT